MRKIFITLLSFLGILSLASCGEATQLPTGTEPTQPAEKTENPKTPPKKKTIIQYCGWDLGTESSPTLKRKMIEEFNKTSDDIMIDMLPSQDPLEKFYTDLKILESMPDVFMVSSVPNAIVKEWAMDVTSLTTQDPEWKNVEGNLKSSVTYYEDGTGVYAIPAAQHYIGFLANYDLIGDYAYIDGYAEDVFAPGAFTTEQFFDVIPDIKSVKTNGTSVVGINAVGDMINWLPSVLDSNYEHFVWNATDPKNPKFDFTSQVMVDALTKIQTLGKIASRNTFNSYADPNAEEDPRVGLFGTSDPSAAFLQGQIGFYQGMTSDDVSNIKFNYKFVGYPDKRVVSTGDFLCISKDCKNPEAAYEVAKFLSFGADGINARYKIVEENKNIDLTGLPVNVDPSVTSKWFDYVEMKGVKEIYDQVVAGEYKVIVEGLKTIPGFESARFTADTGIKIDGVRGGNTLTIGDLIWDVCEGSITIGQYTTNMTNVKSDDLNKSILETLNKIKSMQKK